MVSFTPRPLYPTHWVGVGGGAEPVWTRSRREKSLHPAKVKVKLCPYYEGNNVSLQLISYNCYGDEIGWAGNVARKGQMTQNFVLKPPPHLLKDIGVEGKIIRRILYRWDDIRTDLAEMGLQGVEWMNAFGCGRWPVASPCEHGKSDYYILKKGSAPWNYPRIRWFLRPPSN
jgi:hypothetical protein